MDRQSAAIPVRPLQPQRWLRKWDGDDHTWSGTVGNRGCDRGAPILTESDRKQGGTMTVLPPLALSFRG
ncbi:hypothetical protein MLD38_036763 [Melastoma candidum]|uniref:Uncharacterized protein n=1 Tax=Melastoma candidum TaxID=119954 RepID=A0ACB9LMK1_9MYRT|nr:hypothetical protein MLD38_036763 [Melastoma candidum]